MVTLSWSDTLAIPMLGVALLLLIALVTLGPLVWVAASERDAADQAPCPKPPVELPAIRRATRAQGQEVGMFTCMVCRFATELDDVAVRGSGARCVCLRCFTRETGTARPMPASLRRAVTALLAETPVA